MAIFAETLLDKLNDIHSFTTDLKRYLDKQDGTDKYVSIFLQYPTESVIEKIIENNGIIVDAKHEHGVLFCVPYFWVLNINKRIQKGVISDDVILSDEPVYVRLVIPKEKPIIIYTILTKECIKYKGSDFSLGHTYIRESKIRLSVENVGAKK